MNFHELHYVIQFAMGWTNSHLYQFIVKKDDIYIGIPSEDDYFEIVVGDFSAGPAPTTHRSPQWKLNKTHKLRAKLL